MGAISRSHYIVSKGGDSLDTLLQIIVSGLLIGFVYSLIAIGLTLIYGVMDIVNFAHGAFLMLSMFTVYWLNVLFGFDPLFSLPVSTIAIFLLGLISYKVAVSKVLNAPPIAQIFVTFGLMVFLENLALFLWSPDFRSIQGTIISGNMKIGSVMVSTPKLAAAIGSIIITAIIFWFLSKTRTGRALKATAINRDAAKLMGIDTNKMFALSWGIGGAAVGAAGALLANFYYIFPEVGATFNLLAFVTVALGGFGSIPGALIAGLLIGIIENFAGFFIAPAFKYAVVFVIFILVIVLRPNGLMGGK